MVKYYQMKEILVALLLWIGTNSNNNTDISLPTVLFMEQEQMESVYYVDQNRSGHLYGFYNIEKDIIVLPDTWDRNDPWHLSVLLHELVHYVQDINGIKFQCTAEMEKDSWPLQKQYLANEHEYHWEYDALWHMVISTCNPNG